MSLQSLSSFFGSDKSKRSLQRTEQAFRIARMVAEHHDGLEVRVVIRDKSVVIEAPSAAVAQRLLLVRGAIEGIVKAVIGTESRLSFRVRKTG